MPLLEFTFSAKLQTFHRTVTNEELRLPMKRTSLLTALITCCAFGTAACGGEADDGDATTPTTPAEVMAGPGAPAAAMPPAGAPAAAGGMEAWQGRVFLLDVPQDNWAYPRDIGTEIGPFVPDFLIQVDMAANGSMNVTMTTANELGQQEPCNPTTTITGVSTAFPSSQIGPADIPIHVKSVLVDGLQVNTTVRSFTLTDVLPGAAPASEGKLLTVLDVRELYPMFTKLSDNPEQDQVCNALASFGSPCEACPQDGAMYCLTVEALLLGASDYATPITPVPQVTDPACAGAIQ